MTNTNNDNQTNNSARLKVFFSDLKVAIAGSEKEFTTGTINRAIFMLSVPMILEMVMESLFAIVDVFFVSRVSVNAIATVGLTESVIFLVYAVAIGLAMATTAMIARRIGEKHHKEAADAAVQAIALAMITSLIIGVLGFIFAKDILKLMGASDELIAEGYGYTKWLIGGNITITLLFLLNAIFRGAGDASLAMKSLWLANGLNMILDPLLIFGIGPFPELGVEGAAIATNIGRGTGVLFQLYILLRGGSIVRIRWENIKLRLDVIWKLINVSLGGIGQYLIGTASWLFLVRIVSIFGSEALAGYTIAIRIVMFSILPSWGMANAAATLVGQNLGAEQSERAEKSVWKCGRYNLYFLGLISVIFFIFAEDFIMLFKTEEMVVHYGTLALKYVCSGYIFFAYGMVISQAFNGAGDTRTPTIINFFLYWMLQLPLAYLLAVNMEMGPKGVFAAIVVTEVSLSVVYIWFFRKGRWKTVNI
jgi:putative MATE family efflux protein